MPNFIITLEEFEKALNLYLDLIECGLNAEINVYDRFSDLL